MKTILYILFFIAIGYKTMAQITLIPDPKFEQFLINEGIDSDGVINGQVLTSDVENVTELVFFFGSHITDLTGIQDFTMLEHLYLEHSFDLEYIDVSNNLNLKILSVSQNSLTELDLSKNTLLEELYCGNPEDDVWPQNMISYIDLSFAPNIRIVKAENMGHSLKNIVLKNGNNNANMEIDVSIIHYVWGDPDYDPNETYNTICIEVDNDQVALNNEYPYSEWNIKKNHTAIIFTDNAEECVLSKPTFFQSNIKIYPNPVSDILYFDTERDINKVILFDMLGRKIIEQNNVNTILVSDLQKGSYILKLFSDKGVQTEKVVVE